VSEPCPPVDSGASIRLTPKLSRQSNALLAELLATTRPGELANAVAHALNGSQALSAEEDSRVRTMALLLDDLRQQTWLVDVRDGCIWVTPPLAAAREGEPLAAVKQRVRTAMLAARGAQLNEVAVRSFIRKMETPRGFRGRRVSVLDLVDDGHSLALALSEAAQLPPSERVSALGRIVRPSLEVVAAGAQCEHTGLPLIDVWRYFRHTWSLEYRPTPGRTLFLLIRNAARPMAPVMGIASLANATMQLNVRDRWIGWTTKSVLRRLHENPDHWGPLREALLRTLQEARAAIRSDDLAERIGDVTGPEREGRLLAIASAAARDRQQFLKEREEQSKRGEELPSLRKLPRTPSGEIDWRAASEAPLFVSKRATTLANLLFAERVLNVTPTTPSARLAQELSDSAEVTRALSIAMREIRKVGLASRLLELNVCGAVPPYRELLVGKLVALGVASADAATAYEQRYRGQVSEIASQMAGRAISRSAKACVITTTSLYGVASSQYNRLKISSTTEDGRVHLEWCDLGLTEGYGTAHMGARTVGALRALSTEHRGGRHVNNVFGEGQSPRMRQVREGLDALGLNSEELLRHRSSRRVYGLDLFEGAREALCLNQEPSGERASFTAVATAWCERWLCGRVTNREVLARVARQGPKTVKAELEASHEGPQRSLFLEQGVRTSSPSQVEQESALAPRQLVIMNKQSNPRLIQSLYRAVATCADHHDDQTLTALHIETPVEEFLRRRAAGRVVFVTGHPGDGKTHLLRRLQPVLEAQKVTPCLDANEHTDDDLVEMIERALKSKGRGLVMAINEGILFKLIRGAGNKPWAAAAQEQLLRPWVYRESGETQDPRVVVLDLNLRNNLSKQIVRRALEGLLRLSAPCEACPLERCSLQRNAQRLVGTPFERVVELLEAVAQTGFHATMRDLQGLLSYLLCGDLSCDVTRTEGVSVRPYWQNMFEGGSGPLFDAVRAFDPRELTSPLLDDTLWRHADRPEEWTVHWPAPAARPQPLRDHLDEFVGRKRRALFEHEQGGTFIRSGGSRVDQELRQVMEPGTKAVRRLIRMLNRFFDRGEDNGSVLHLWMTHRYDAHPARFAAAAAEVHWDRLEILLPRLRPGLDEAFPDYRPNHALLCSKGGSESQGLRIDRPLVQALIAAEQGLPSGFQRGEPEARIASFINKLAKSHGDLAAENEVQVRLVDRDGGGSMTVTVDVANRRYIPR
jgi:hypothetical protein